MSSIPASVGATVTWGGDIASTKKSYVSNRPTTLGRAFQWYATKQDLIDRGFPTVDGQPIPVTKEHLSQQGYADSPDYRAYSDSRKGNYYYFYKTSDNIHKYTMEWVIEAQQKFSDATGEITYKWVKDPSKPPRAKGSVMVESTFPSTSWLNQFKKKVPMVMQ